jgi:hypothetical protein
MILSLGRDYFSLLKCIRLEFMSDEGISLFVDNVEYCEFTSDI